MLQSTSPNSVEERLTSLEQQIAQLRAAVDKLAQPKDWRSTIGMFAGDEVMGRIREAGRKIREAERRRAKKGSKPRSHRIKK